MIRYIWTGLPSLHTPASRAFGTASRRLQAPRINQVGIQYLSKELHAKVFPNHSPEEFANPQNPALLELARAHLKQSNLLGKKTQITDPISIPHFPDLVGKNTLDEHFTRIGSRYSEPYLSMAKKFLAEGTTLPEMPKKWLLQSGWTRYAPDRQPEKVAVPTEDELVFDVEVLYKKSHYPVIATAVSREAWYGWVSPIMTSYRNGCVDWDHLIPLETHRRPKLLIGYNVSYDRARVKEEYSVKRSKAFYMDAMAFHIATSGFCSQQRPLYQKHKKNSKAAEAESMDEDTVSLMDPEFDADESAQEVAQGLIDDPWLKKGSPNSLANAAEFHCGIKMNKEARDYFSGSDLNVIIDNFQYLMEYCAQDVYATYKVTQKVFPEFCLRNPHPVSFAALRLMGSLFLPTTRKWEKYLESAERVYQENREEVSKILLESVAELIRYVEQNDESLKPDFENDPWLKQMNWDLKLPRLKKDGSAAAKQAYMTGYPEWYRELFKTVKSESGISSRELNLTVRTRVTPFLLRLKWEGFPLIWTDSAGWCFKVPNEEDIVGAMLAKNYHKADLSAKDQEKMLPELRDDGNNFELFKIPHPAGPKSRCTIIMSKSYLRYFESGVLTSEYEHAAKILSLNATASYWMGNRSRIAEQFVVYSDKEGKKNKFFDTQKDMKERNDMGMIIPKLCTMGTVTRRATENTWLTASNSKKNRIGSELKALVEAPKGFVFVGADVDSEELWIASLIGDALFKVHGGTALGWMTLEGDKNEKTDLHSKTAEIMGILRGDAKIFNYGRIYGAGVKFATQLLKQCNASIDDESAVKIAQELYERTKGKTTHSKVFGRRVYHGGTESVMFNALESIAYLENPKTPVLGCSITDALTQKNLNKNNYLTSRINWTIQSSGVDYLHLLIVSMEYLTEKFKVDARLMITVHDELRYMVREDQKLLTVLLLQISNLWTRAMFCEQMGINELPQSVAFFSEVDIDMVLRKEVGLECITPSHPETIPPGESYTIQKLMQTYDVGTVLRESFGILQDFKSSKYNPRKSLILTLDGEQDEAMRLGKLRLQNSVSKDEWTKNMTLYLKHQSQKSKPSKKPRNKFGMDMNAFAGRSSELTDSHFELDSEALGFEKRLLSKPKKRKLRKGIVEDISLTKKVDGTNSNDGSSNPDRVTSMDHHCVKSTAKRVSSSPERPLVRSFDNEGFGCEPKIRHIRTEGRYQSRPPSEFGQKRPWPYFPQSWSPKKSPTLSANYSLSSQKPTSSKAWRPINLAGAAKSSLVPLQLNCAISKPKVLLSEKIQEAQVGAWPSDENFKRRREMDPVIKGVYARTRRRS